MAIRPVRGPYGPMIYDKDGHPVHPDTKWARLDGNGWMVPPAEIQPMLDLLNPQLLWAPMRQEFEIHKQGRRSRFTISIKPDAPIAEWKQVLMFLADWQVARKDNPDGY